MAKEPTSACPFCKMLGAWVERTPRRAVQVVCFCGATGPFAIDEEAARKEWNARPHLQAAVAAETERCADVAKGCAPEPVGGVDTRVIHGAEMATAIAAEIRKTAPARGGREE